MVNNVKVYILLLNLVLSIISFSLLISAQEIKINPSFKGIPKNAISQGDGTYLYQNKIYVKGSDGNLYPEGTVFEILTTKGGSPLSSTYKPTGVKGFLEKWVAPEGWTAPQGSVVIKTGEDTFVSFKSMEDYNKAKLPEGSTIVSTEGGAASGFGHSVSGIIEGAMWAMTVYMGIKMIGPMLGLSKEQTDAAATAAGQGFPRACRLFQQAAAQRSSFWKVKSCRGWLR